MYCPKCDYDGSRVIDSRPAEDGKAIRRRRACDACGYRFTTFERVEVVPLLVIKKNGEREAFQREKILRGIVRSAEKRPISHDQMDRLVSRVEQQIRQASEHEIPSEQIGEYVMEQLMELDEIAYIRFASVYRQFQDKQVFLKELQEIMERDQS